MAGKSRLSNMSLSPRDEVADMKVLGILHKINSVSRDKEQMMARHYYDFLPVSGRSWDEIHIFRHLLSIQG